MKNKIRGYVERLTGGMAESNREALFLLFSVILLASVVRGAVLPLRETCAALREQARLAKREEVLLRSYAADTGRTGRLLQSRLKLAVLRDRFAFRAEPAAEVHRLYEAADRHRVKVRLLRQCAGCKVVSDGDVPELSSWGWEIELSGGYYDLRDFLREAGSGGCCTIFDRVQLLPEDPVSDIPVDRLHLRGRVSVFSVL